MGTINALRPGGAQLHSLSDAAENLRLGQQHGGVFESVTLSDDARPTARTGLGERMRGALDRVDVRGAFSSIGSRLSQAGSSVSDAVGRATHSFLRAANQAGEAIAAKLGIRTSTAVMKTAYATVQSEEGNYVHGQDNTYLRNQELAESNVALRASCAKVFQPALDAFAARISGQGLAVSSQRALDDAMVRADIDDAEKASTAGKFGLCGPHVVQQG